MTDEKYNPTVQRGGRNVFCSHYGDCLDYVIEQSWESWNCDRCALRFGQSLESEGSLISGEDYTLHSCNFWISGQDAELLSVDL